MMTERALITALEEITGAPFEVERPQENRVLLGKLATHFVWCSDIAYSKETGPLKAAWKANNGDVWLETSKIGDMIALVEHAYGEKGVHSIPIASPGVIPSGNIPEEVAGFPKVVKLLRAYEDVVSKISKRYGVELKMLYDGGAGVSTVRVGARISPVPDQKEMEEAIVRTAKVLKEAYDGVMDVESP
jgi:hypothetical protein